MTEAPQTSHLPSMPGSNLRIMMLGTGEFALPTFMRLLDGGFRVVALVTQPERPQGRKRELIVSPIKRAAIERGIPVEQPEDVNSAEAIECICSYRPDILVTAAYGQILSHELLSVPRLGGMNLHGSVLPAYRGAAPVARAIERSESETGVTIIQMSPRVDAGGMLAVARTPIAHDETAGELEARLAALGAPLVAECLHAIASGNAIPLPQDAARVSRAPKLKKDDGRINWKRSAEAIHNQVRAMNPWPLAYSLWGPSAGDKPPARLIVHRARVAPRSGVPGRVIECDKHKLLVGTGEGSLELLLVQVPGRKPMPIDEFLRGHRIVQDDRFG